MNEQRNALRRGGRPPESGTEVEPFSIDKLIWDENSKGQMEREEAQLI